MYRLGCDNLRITLPPNVRIALDNTIPFLPTVPVFVRWIAVCFLPTSKKDNNKSCFPCFSSFVRVNRFSGGVDGERRSLSSRLRFRQNLRGRDS